MICMILMHIMISIKVRMDWKTLLACITGSVEARRLLRNGYQVEERRA